MPLDRLRDAGWLDSRLGAAGLAAEARRSALDGIEAAAMALIRDGASPGDPAISHFVPGRIELLGKHTDYAGGRSLLVASEQAISTVTVADAREGVSVLDAGGGVEPYRESARTRRSGWQIYPDTLTGRLRRDFPDVRGGVKVAFMSSIPPAAGMSSSSGLLVALFLAVGTRWRLFEGEWVGGASAEVVGGPEGGAEGAPHPVRVTLADYTAAIEAGRRFGMRGRGIAVADGERPHAGVGTEGGSQDHTAILCCQAARASRFGFRPTRFEDAVEVPAGWRFGVAVSGVEARKVEGARDAYNRLAREARGLVEVWRRETGEDLPHLGALLEGGVVRLDRLRRVLERTGGPGEGSLARLEQFVGETLETIPAAFGAMVRADPAAFGDAVRRSQELAERGLRNQVPETVELVRLARELGAPAASAFGAGFGGSVWCLLPEGDAPGFHARWRAAYLDRFPSRAGTEQFLSTGAGPPALRLT